MTDSILDRAISYRRRGLSVIPIKTHDKRPLVSWEPYQKEPPTEAQIQRWWTELPQASLGIVTGAVSDCVVLDLNDDEARQKLKEMFSTYDFSAVPRSRTGRGWHLFFKHPGGIVGNSAAVIPGMDVRGDGGYVVAPPSIHPNGKTYKWEVPINGVLPKLPVELFKLISSPVAGNENGYRERFNTAEALAGVPEGQRDETIFRLACKLRSADVPEDMASALILEAAGNCDPPFSEAIAIEKVRRAYSKYEPKRREAKATEPKKERTPITVNTRTRISGWTGPEITAPEGHQVVTRRMCVCFHSASRIIRAKIFRFPTPAKSCIGLSRVFATLETCVRSR